ncbi:CO2+/MG2+ efflux protein ApaG [Pseudomonas aeruginosa]|nr:CO2+/MG2+ efflux protein ApaG [Pseudomonas aeruginosa]
MSDTQHQVNVRVDTRYLPEQSAPEQNRFAFAYTVTIENQGRGSGPTAVAPLDHHRR